MKTKYLPGGTIGTQEILRSPSRVLGHQPDLSINPPGEFFRTGSDWGTPRGGAEPSEITTGAPAAMTNAMQQARLQNQFPGNAQPQPQDGQYQVKNTAGEPTKIRSLNIRETASKPGHRTGKIG